MSTEYTQILTSSSTGVTVSNSTSMTSLFSYSVPGGSLDTHNRLRWQMQGIISFKDQDQECDLYMYYAGITVCSCTIKNSAAGARLNNGLRVDAFLSGDDSINSQFGTIHSYLGLPRDEDGSTPIGFGTIGASSNGDQTFEIKAQWGATGASNSIFHAHSTLELISYVEDVPTDDLDDPTALIFLNSKLNNLRYDLRKDVYFYAPLEHDLLFYGYGSVGFTRSSSSTAVWRDGVAHTVAADVPRFEYDGDTVLGLGITSTETLNYDTDNALHSSNTICWLLDGEYQSTARGDINPINSDGDYIGANGHIMQIVKFNKQITSAEDVETEVALLS